MMSCSSFSKTPSTTSAERFGSLESSFEHFGTSCPFWVQKGGTPRPRACGAHKARPVPGTAQANAEAENDEVPFFPAPAATFASRLLHVQKSGPETHTIRQTESEFIGVGRREPAHGMQISCVGQGAAWPNCSLYVCVCVCVCNGATPKKSRFLENRVFVFITPTTREVQNCK